MKNNTLLLTLIASLGGTVSANADVAFSNLTSGANPYNANVSYSAKYGTMGFEFTSGSTGVIDGLQLAVNDSGTPLPLDVDIYTVTSSNGLGTSLGSYSGTSSGDPYYDSPTGFTSVDLSSATVDLNKGESYWLVMASPDFLQWNIANNNPMGLVIKGSGAPATNIQGAFAVNTSAIAAPGPSTCLTFGVSCVGAWLRRRKK